MRVQPVGLAVTLLLSASACGGSGQDAPATATIRVTTTGDGSGIVDSTPPGLVCPGPCTLTVDQGAAVTLTPHAAPGSTFVGWNGAGCTGSAACTLTATGDVAIQAGFALDRSVVVTRAGTGSGTVTSSPPGIDCGADCSQSYGQGTVVTLTAVADHGSTFAGWSGACSGSGTCAVTAETAQLVVATFTLEQYTLLVSRSGSGAGTVASTPPGIACGADCTEAYGHATVVTMTAEPAEGSSFGGWGGSCTGTGPCTVTMTAAATVTASFDLLEHAVTVAKTGTGGGTITSTPAGVDCGATCTASFTHGTTVTLAAVAATDSIFIGWGQPCSGTGPCVLTPTAATTVTANFTLKQYTLTVSRAGAGVGTVTSSPAGIACGADCTQVYDHGTAVTLVATPTAGSYFAGWSGLCTGTGSCTVTMTATNTVTATFSPRGSLYAIRDSDGMLQRGDPDTGTLADVGLLRVAYAFGDCAYNDATGTLYMVDGRGARALYRLNLATGAATAVGVHNITDVFALAYHPPSGNLYGIALGNLYRFNTTTGLGTLVGATGVTGGSIDGLAWDSARSRLVGLKAGTASVYSVDVATGAATLLAGNLPFIDNSGWTYDPVIDRLWAVEYGGAIYQYHPVSFARDAVATGTGAHTCITYVP